MAARHLRPVEVRLPDTASHLAFVNIDQPPAEAGPFTTHERVISFLHDDHDLDSSPADTLTTTVTAVPEAGHPGHWPSAPCLAGHCRLAKPRRKTIFLIRRRLPSLPKSHPRGGPSRGRLVSIRPGLVGAATPKRSCPEPSAPWPGPGTPRPYIPRSISALPKNLRRQPHLARGAESIPMGIR